MTAAPIMHEPTDAPDLPVVPVTRAVFDSLARSAVIELGGGEAAVTVGGAVYVLDGAAVAS